jgi:chaperonin GroES
LYTWVFPTNRPVKLAILNGRTLPDVTNFNDFCVPKLDKLPECPKRQSGTVIDGLGQTLKSSLPKIQKKHMAKINFKPNEDRVLVEAAEAEVKTASGIFIPDTAKEKPQKGKIIAVGEGIKDKPVTVKVGDHVLYGKYAGTEITIDGKEYLIMRNSDIFGII